jgi:serine/threonine protein kinase
MSIALDNLLLGRVLAGRYEIQEVIGRGGMSVVYRGLDRTLGRRVAVKLIALPSASDEVRANLRERFRREAGAAAQIPHHPNVVQIYDYGTDSALDLDFIVMELLVGRDLKEALAKSPPSREEALRTLREAARGLAAGHRGGIVHRDVKPANLFLVGEGALESVRILDFGIAKPLQAEDDLTQAGQLPHSPAYASPEQLDAGRPVTAASDVYQLGLIAYELLAGERPFDEEARARIRAGEDVPLRGGARWDSVPEHLRRVVEKALRPRPEERFPDAAAFAEALSAAREEDHTLLAAAPPPLPDATVAAPPPPRTAAPPPPPPQREAPRLDGPPRSVPPSRPGRFGGHGALWAAGLALLLLLGLWAATRGSDEPEEERTAASSPADTAGLGGEFEELEERAAREEMSGVPRAGREPPENLRAQQRAAAQVQEAVLELNDSWVKGDLGRHLGFYADRLERFYGCNDCPRERVRQERERDLRAYDRDRKITVLRQAVTFPGDDPDRARVLVDKEWEFVGEGRRRTGAGRQELVLEHRDGRWQVVSERMLETYRSRGR